MSWKKLWRFANRSENCCATLPRIRKVSSPRCLDTVTQYSREARPDSRCKGLKHIDTAIPSCYFSTATFFWLHHSRRHGKAAYGVRRKENISHQRRREAP